MDLNSRTRRRTRRSLGMVVVPLLSLLGTVLLPALIRGPVVLRDGGMTLPSSPSGWRGWEMGTCA